jgi:hypothetical protein
VIGQSASVVVKPIELVYRISMLRGMTNRCRRWLPSLLAGVVTLFLLAIGNSGVAHAHAGHRHAKAEAVAVAVPAPAQHLPAVAADAAGANTPLAITLSPQQASRSLHVASACELTPGTSTVPSDGAPCDGGCCASLHGGCCVLHLPHDSSTTAMLTHGGRSRLFASAVAAGADIDPLPRPPNSSSLL